MNKVIIFTVGAATGALITWKLVEMKYKKIADEEIASVVEHYEKKNRKEEKMGNPYAENYNEVNELDDVKKDYTQRITDLGYADDDATVILESAKEVKAPYVISPDEFGETQYYSIKNFTYYADYVLVDEDDEIISDPEDIIGDALAHFGEFEEDSVHVRNENTECDYEILKSEKTFSEAYGEDS